MLNSQLYMYSKLTYCTTVTKPLPFTKNIIKTIEMFSSIFGFGYNIFITLVLLLTAGITAHLCYGYGTYKAKETYIMLILLLMIGTQMYYLINAATYIPATRFYTYNVRSSALSMKNDHYQYYYHIIIILITIIIIISLIFIIINHIINLVHH